MLKAHQFTSNEIADVKTLEDADLYLFRDCDEKADSNHSVSSEQETSLGVRKCGRTLCHRVGVRLRRNKRVRCRGTPDTGPPAVAAQIRGTVVHVGL